MGECPQCGLVFTTAVPSFAEQRYGPDWFEKEYLPSFGIDPENPRTDHLGPRFDQDLELIERHAKKGTILDIGAGAGLFLNRAKQRGWTVRGVEPASYGVEFAKRNFGIELFGGMLQEAPFEEASFDAIVLQDVIEHVSDPREILQCVRKLVRKGGVVFITTPNYGSISRQLYRSNWALISPAEHLSLFRAQTLSYVLDATGFSIKELDSTSELSVPRFHFPTQRFLRLRRSLLQTAESILPSAMLRRFALGDELIAIGAAV